MVSEAEKFEFKAVTGFVASLIDFNRVVSCFPAFVIDTSKDIDFRANSRTTVTSSSFLEPITMDKLSSPEIEIVNYFLAFMKILPSSNV